MRNKRSFSLEFKRRVVEELMSGEYEATIEEQAQIINEMSDLISRYQEIINQNASYFEEIPENLKDLSTTVSE